MQGRCKTGRSKAVQKQANKSRREQCPAKYIQSDRNVSTEVKTNGQIQKKERTDSSTRGRSTGETHEGHQERREKDNGRKSLVGRDTGGEKPQIKQEVTRTNRFITKNNLAPNPFGRDNHVEIVAISQLSG